MLPSAVNVNLYNPITCLNRYFSLVRMSIGLDRFRCIFFSQRRAIINIHVSYDSHLFEVKMNLTYHYRDK